MNNSAGTTLYDRIGGQEGLLTLLTAFYADVRQQQLIGPIFQTHVEDWPAHIRHIAEFWARATGGPSRYTGSMPAPHVPLQLAGGHFAAWLGLWEFNCRRHLAPPEAQEMIQLAEGLGARLRQLVTVSGRTN